MASTRNKNTKGDYNLEQNINTSINDWNTYEFSSRGSAYNQAMPSVGYIPSKMCTCFFSKNGIDIESQLYGIGSSNLVNEKQPVKPQLKEIKTVDFFDRQKLLMPKPLVIENNQRPLQ